MRNEDYKQWLRYKAALAHSGADPRDPFGWIEARQAEGQTDFNALNVAQALGIAKRLRLDWMDDAARFSYPVFIARYALDAEIDVSATLVQASDASWLGSADDVRVVGHPDHASAQEHLERLLGGEVPNDE